jgi:hypothetical protein
LNKENAEEIVDKEEALKETEEELFFSLAPSSLIGNSFVKSHLSLAYFCEHRGDLHTQQ